MSLRWRLALLVGLIVAVTVVGVSYAAWVSTEEELEATLDDSLRAAALSPLPRRDPRGDERPPIALGTLVQLLTPEGAVVVASSPVALPVDEVDRAVAAGDQGPTIRDVDVDGTDYRLLTSPAPRGALQVARDRSEIDDALAGLRTRLALAGLLATAMAAAVGWLIARRLTGPVERLTAATERVAAGGDIDEPIDVQRGDEVGRLAASFTTMLAALRESRRQQHQLVMDASHELRTPLTTLRTNIELLARAPDLDPTERQDLLRDTTAELEELSALVAELVDLATDQADETASHEALDLAALVDAVVTRARRRYDRPVTLRVQTPAPVSGVAAQLERAVSNLVDNADKFSPPGAPIEVVVHGTAVSVADHGPGIPPAERSQVFARFYRVESARTLPGSGLGLAIVDQVARAHDAQVAITDTPGGGATVTLTLPPPPA